MIKVFGTSEGLRGEVAVPGDKSISHRAAIVGALASGISRVWGFSTAGDCRSTLHCLSALGVQLSLNEGELVVSGLGGTGFSEPAEALFAGNSGTTMRMLAGAIASQPLDVTITGDESLLERPMSRVAGPLAMMGADVRALGAGGRPPLRIKGGGLVGIDYEMPVASAQVKSAVLLAGLGARGATTVREKVRTRDHTERMLARACIAVREEELSVTIEPGIPRGLSIEVPGDFSSAAYVVAASLVCPGSDVTVRSVGLNPTRTGFIELARRMGADVTVSVDGSDSEEPRGDIAARYSELTATDVDAEEVARAIDEVPLVALLATQASGRTVISGADELKVKESDRLSATIDGLRTLGASVQEVPGGMVIEGPTKLEGAGVTGRRDHRIAMMLAVAGLAANGRTGVDGWEWTEISYPGFAEVVREIGGRVY